MLCLKVVRVYFDVPFNSKGKFDVILDVYVDGQKVTLILDPWWNNSWSYKQEIEIYQNSGGALTKLGSGTLVLAAANTYTGSTSVVAGTLVWEAAGTGRCDGPATATLTDGAVEVADGLLSLPDLELRNEFFGCFAG